MGSVVGSVVGGLIGGSAQKKAASKAAAAQEKAARAAAEQFRAYDINTPLGSAKLKGSTLSANLSGQARQILDNFAAESNLDVNATAKNLYDAMQGLAERGEQDARRTTQEQLFRSGRLGTAGGIRQIGEVERALADARINRELSAYETAFNMRQGAFNNYALMAQLPATNLIAASVNRNPAAGQAAAGMINAGNIRAGSSLAFGNALGGAIGGAFDQYIMPSISSAFSGGFGSPMQSFDFTANTDGQGYGFGAGGSGYSTAGTGGGWIGL